jgi:hypothetical protein
MAVECLHLAQMRSAGRARQCLMFGVDRTYRGHHETDAFVLELPPAFVRASGFAIAYGIGASLFGGATQLILGVAKSRNWLRRKSRRNAKNADVEDAGRFPV